MSSWLDANDIDIYFLDSKCVPVSLFTMSSNFL